MGKKCETCGQTRWEGRQVEGYVESLRADLEQAWQLLAEVYEHRLHNGGYVPSELGDRIARSIAGPTPNDCIHEENVEHCIYGCGDDD